MKRCFSVMLVVTLICTQMVLFSAKGEVDESNPLFMYISDISPRLTISSGNAACSGKIYANNDNSNITMTVTLYKKSGSAWVRVTGWSDSVTGSDYLSISRNYSVNAGTYKVVVTGTVTVPEVGSENATASSAEVVCH